MGIDGTNAPPGRDGSGDIAEAVALLASRIPPELAPLARLAFNYWWSWAKGGPDVFREIDPDRWIGCNENPVLLLQETTLKHLNQAAENPDLVARAASLVAEMRADLARPWVPGPVTPERPVAFVCAEFGIHRSLYTYSGGLGILAGDFLKQASDHPVPYVAVGLMYRQGYFRQRLDTTGWQYEYWHDADPELLPMARVTQEDGTALTFGVPIRGREVRVQIWRVDVGRVPLFLLDVNRPENPRVDRWISSRLYVGDRDVRLAQYALLGLGAIRALRLMGIDPGVVHLNEGHAAFAPLEMAREAVADGLGFDAALESARSRVVFTTHTPVAAGNESYPADEITHVLGDLPGALGVEPQKLFALGRSHASDQEPVGMTQLAIRTSRSVNGVSRKHGEVAREMWQHLWPGLAARDIPIGHVTNGVHLPTWIAPEMRALLARHLGPDWEGRAHDQVTWSPIPEIPDEEIWTVRNQLRERLVAFVRDRSVLDRLSRGDSSDYVEAAARSFDANVLTIGFARRVATYKRLHLFTYDPDRGLRLLQGKHPVQFLVAGKAHPRDEEAKRNIQMVFSLKGGPGVAERVAYLEDYDMGLATHLVRGCDVWINLPRPPLEASGTSGMKVALNGGLNLSVLDGWWEEGYDGLNGWAIPSDPTLAMATQDTKDIEELFSLLEQEVVPLFYDRDAQGIPRGWIRRIKASLCSIGPSYNAARMLEDYLQRVYTPI